MLIKTKSYWKKKAINKMKKKTASNICLTLGQCSQNLLLPALALASIRRGSVEINEVTQVLRAIIRKAVILSKR